MYYLLGVSVTTATLNGIFLKKGKIGDNSLIFNFNIITSILWCILLFLLNKCTVTINALTLLWGIAYGLVQASFVLFKTLALRSGPVSVTTLIGNSSLLLSIIVSAILWNEKIIFIQCIGVALLIFSIILCTYRKSETVFKANWKIYSFFFAVFSGLVGITFKAFSKSGNTEYTNDMMIIASFIMTVCYLLISIKANSIKPFLNPDSKQNFIFYALLTGLLSCVYNRLNITLSGKIDAVIFFPVFNGGVILLSCVLGFVLCGEKLTLKQTLGIITGCVALCIIGIF